ncbi:MAG: ABC transporter ATP-binding protein [Bacteroidia bacterium]|nr:ABC transporter ATP-binding protein [Bacteroidia bacterium]
MTQIAISVQNVTKTFNSGDRHFTALNAIDLDIKAGEYLAITGKSGSGKSTLLNMITGIDHPTSGTIKIHNTELGNMNEHQLSRWRGENIGIVFQFFQLIPTLTIGENLLLAMEFVGVIPKKERKERVKALLAKVGIESQTDKMPASLSGGEQQRAAIARALVNDPRIIVADEPTGNLDSENTAAVHNLLQSLAASGKTVVVVTHEVHAETRFDRTLTMSDGKILTT